MSVFTHETMTHRHDHPSVFSRIGETLQVWRERQHARRELARVSERDLQDAGLSLGDALYEAGKPFWRA